MGIIVSNLVLMTKSRTQSYRSELSTSIVGGLLMLMHQSLLAKNLVSSSISTRFTASLTRSANAAGASRYVHGWGVVGLVCRRAGRAAGSISYVYVLRTFFARNSYHMVVWPYYSRRLSYYIVWCLITSVFDGFLTHVRHPQQWLWLMLKIALDVEMWWGCRMFSLS